MRKKLFMLIACALLAFSCAMLQSHKIQVTKAEVGDHTYEGMVDPRVVIETWIQMKGETIQIEQYWWEVYYQNPDKDSKISVVCTLRYINGFCQAYSYLYDGELYCFMRNEKNCFKLYDWTDREGHREALKQRLLSVHNGATV